MAVLDFQFGVSIGDPVDLAHVAAMAKANNELQGFGEEEGADYSDLAVGVADGDEEISAGQASPSADQRRADDAPRRPTRPSTKNGVLAVHLL